MKKLTNKDFWESRKNFKLNFNNYKPSFGYILKKILDYDTNKTFLEIGCVPGKNMIYFTREFGYQPVGIDYTDQIDKVGSTLKSHGIEKFKLYKKDFFHFDESNKYDVVFSDGFVEHFDDVETIFKKHIKLLANNGTLIISLPNMRYIQYFIRKLFGVKEFSSIHNLEVMNLDIWCNLAKQHNLYIEYCNYDITFDTWICSEKKKGFLLCIYAVFKIIPIILNYLCLGKIPNRWYSPRILLIARKKQEYR